MILVASTMARYVTDREDTSLAWLYNAEKMRELSPQPVEFFAAIEVDGEGIAPFLPLINRLLPLCNYGAMSNGSPYWTMFSYGGRENVTTENRLWRICMGRNLIQDHAMDIGASHILFLDADMEPPADCISRLLELEWPIVGGHVPTYNLYGPKVNDIVVYDNETWRSLVHEKMAEKPYYPDDWDVQEHMNTAGFLLVAREVFKRIRWRYSPDDGMTDDPCYEADAREFLGYPTFVRHDVIGQHHPASILPIEHRFPERDMSVKP